MAVVSIHPSVLERTRYMKKQGLRKAVVAVVSIHRSGPTKYRKLEEKQKLYMYVQRNEWDMRYLSDWHPYDSCREPKFVDLTGVIVSESQLTVDLKVVGLVAVKVADLTGLVVSESHLTVDDLNAVKILALQPSCLGCGRELDGQAS